MKTGFRFLGDFMALSIRHAACLIMAGALLAGCASHRAYTYADRTAAGNAAADAKYPTRTQVHNIILTEGDITDRDYVVLGDITANVAKNTLFDPDPTREMIDKELKKQASAMGADAVILVRYGSVGVTLMSWGELDGKGRAVAFKADNEG